MSNTTTDNQQRRDQQSAKVRSIDSRQRRLSMPRNAVIFAVKFNIFAIGLQALWNTINTLTLPDLVEKTVRGSLNGTALGVLSLVGIGVAAFAQPIAGRISDLSNLDDRRRPYIAIGTLASLPMLAIVGWSPTFVVLVAAYVGLQLGTNLAQAAYQALIPDLLGEQERGLASGIKNALNVIGAAIGVLGTRLLQSQGAGAGIIVIWLGSVLLVTMLLSMRWVPRVPPLAPEKQAESWRNAIDIGPLLQSFRRTFREHRVFRLSVIAQFCFLLGVYPGQRFALLFLRDRFGHHAEQKASLGIAGAIVVAAIVAVIAGALSESIGRRPVLAASILLGAVGMIGLGFSPTLFFVAVTGSLVAAGIGGFLAVNWALMSDDMPEGEAASAYGLSNLATAGSSALAGLFGPLVDIMRSVLAGSAYEITFGLAGLIAATALIPLHAIGKRKQGSGEAGR